MLTTKPARKDLTDRECAKLIGALLGGLLQMTDVDTLKSAVRWWAESDKAWTILEMIDGSPGPNSS